MAERQGFEPWGPLGPTVFKTAAIDHSAISPLQKYIFFKFLLKKFSDSKGFDEKSIFFEGLNKHQAIVQPFVDNINLGNEESLYMLRFLVEYNKIFVHKNLELLVNGNSF